MKQVTRSELKQIDHVEFTATWSPHHHNTVLEVVDRQLKDMGLNPMNESLEVSDNGMNLFGHVGIKSDEGAQYMLGFRNSMQKSFALGFVAGESVYVCSNMGFFGDFRETHIHNARLDLEALWHFVGQAINAVQDEITDYQEWFAQLKHLSIGNDELKVLVYDLMMANIIPPSKFNQFRNDFRAEQKDQTDYASDMTLAHLYGAATRTIRGSSVNSNMSKTRALNNYVRELVPAFEIV